MNIETREYIAKLRSRLVNPINEKSLKEIIETYADDMLKNKEHRIHSETNEKNYGAGYSKANRIYNSINIHASTNTGVVNQKQKREFHKKLWEDVQRTYSANAEYEYQKIGKVLKGSGWETYQSWHLTGTERIKDEDYRHRLYLGVNPDSIYDMSSEIYERLKQKGVPFYFKVADFGHRLNKHTRKDSIVMYATDENLRAYMQSLGEISKERPDLIKKCEEPSRVVNNISGFVGYAPEVPNAEHSYTDLMSMAIRDGLTPTYSNWLLEYPNTTITYNGRTVRLADVKSSGVWSDEDVIAIQALGLAKLSENRKYLLQAVEQTHQNMANMGLSLGNFAGEKY